MPADDAGGLETVISIACGAHVMLTANLWVDVGLVNGAVVDICYQSGGPPELPVAVMVKLDCYSGPTSAQFQLWHFVVHGTPLVFRIQECNFLFNSHGL